jgi:hypothetical protein
VSDLSTVPTVDTYSRMDYYPSVDEFWKQAGGRLEAMERSKSWLARRIGVSRSQLNNWSNGYRPTPERVRRDVALLLDISGREPVAA